MNRIEFQTRLKGTRQQYYVLKVWKPGVEIPIVHTSKNLSYILKMRDRYT